MFLEEHSSKNFARTLFSWNPRVPLILKMVTSGSGESTFCTTVLAIDAPDENDANKKGTGGAGKDQ
jgi:hypothetical protein